MPGKSTLRKKKTLMFILKRAPFACLHGINKHRQKFMNIKYILSLLFKKTTLKHGLNNNYFKVLFPVVVTRPTPKILNDHEKGEFTHLFLLFIMAFLSEVLLP